MNTRYLFGTSSGFGLMRTFAADGEGDAGGGGSAPAAAPAAPAGEPAAADPPAGAPAEGGDEGAGPPAGEPAAAPAGEPAAAAEPAGGEPAEPPGPKRIPWERKRLDTVTAKLKAAEEATALAQKQTREAEGRAAAYEALYGRPDGAPAAGAAPPAPADPAAPRAYTPAEFEAETARRANLRTLSEKCERLFDAGLAAQGTAWQKRVDDAAQAFGAVLQTRNDFWEAVTDLPNGAAVYNLLAGDLDHFAEVLEMSPVKLGMELASLSTKAAAIRSPAVSRAPAPIDPLEGPRGGGELPLDKVDMPEYARRRDIERAERWKLKNA